MSDISDITQLGNEPPNEAAQEEGIPAQAVPEQVGSPASSCASNTVCYWDKSLGDYYLLTTLPHDAKDTIHSMAASPDAGILFTCTDKRTICEWKNGYYEEVSQSGPGEINVILVRNDSSEGLLYVYCARTNGDISVLRRNVNEVHGMFEEVGSRTDIRLNAEQPIVKSMCLSDDEKYIYCGLVDGDVRVFYIELVNITRSIDYTDHFNNGTAVHALAVGPQVVFSGLKDGKIKMWKRQGHDKEVKHSVIWTFDIQNGPVINALVFSNVDGVSGNYLYAGSSDGIVRCWKNMSMQIQGADGPEPEIMKRVRKHSGEIMNWGSEPCGEITCLAICDGPFVFAGMSNGYITVWRRVNEDMLHKLAVEIQTHESEVQCIAAQKDWRVDVAGPRMWILYSSDSDVSLIAWAIFDQETNTKVKENLREDFRSLYPN